MLKALREREWAQYEIQNLIEQYIRDNLTQTVVITPDYADKTLVSVKVVSALYLEGKAFSIAEDAINLTSAEKED